MRDRLKDLISRIKKLTYDETSELCAELRDYIIDVVSKNGGHLASSLGAVEISVLLHRILSTPEDKIIWDVGHQAYAHKILTGRIDEFQTLRTYGGISGFPRTCESPHDAFSVGHSSTSISAAVGYAVGKKQQNKNNTIVAVIGDGSISSGMPFEAMNQASQIKDLDITVILNDNEMSISPNVGALSRYFNNLRTDPIYIGIRDDVEYLISKIPAIGKNMINVLERVSTGLKTVIDPGAFFLHLGWDYYGPVDGHDINALNKILKKVLKIKGLKILHVITKKGKGYLPAEKEPSKFHGVGIFNKETGELGKSSSVSATSVVSDYLVELGENYKELNVITAAMPDGTGTKKFGELFPNRYFDIGISEEHATTFAAGMCLDGLIPVVAIYSTFMQR
ncbi:MAG: 1-deoxy-D-xylulose-5-phosphate synthase, partial [Candidatus Muirbacterium halophilum]|nr:1-deoxy-D-xylulose-5-phosphate synthase [Candidatus Muirbacterium halophilum]